VVKVFFREGGKGWIIQQFGSCSVTITNTQVEMSPKRTRSRHCLTRNLTLRNSRNTLTEDHRCVFNQPTTPPISVTKKDQKQLACVSRVRFLVRQPEDSPSCRQRCLAQAFSRGGDHERRSESSNQERIPLARATTVSQGIVCQAEKPAAGCFYSSDIARAPWISSIRRN
jgi:hypothetical protein